MHHKVYVLLFYNCKNLFLMIFYCNVDDLFTLVDQYHADMMQIEINNVTFMEKIKVHIIYSYLKFTLMVDSSANNLTRAR